MADVKWIKITTDIFDDEKILLIESLPEADSIIVIWFKLLCLAGKQNNSGVFLMGDKIAYTDKMLATIFRRKESTVKLALQTFEQFGMVELIDGVITIPNWEKHQNIDRLEQIKEQTRVRVAKHREKQKMLSCNVTVTEDVTQCNAVDKIRKDKIRKEEEKNNNNTASSEPDQHNKKPSKHKYGEYQHVLLTDSERDKLTADFGSYLLDKAITFLDEYIEEKGYKSKSHNLAIRRWVIGAVKEQEAKAQRKVGQKQTKADELDDAYKMMSDWAEE